MNKKGYWYTGIYEGYRYRIKNNFIPNEWKLVQYMLDLITEDDVRKAKRKSNKEFSFTYTELNQFFGIKEANEAIEKILESFVQRAIWRMNVEKDGNYEAIVLIQTMNFKAGVFNFSINYLAVPYLFLQKMNLDKPGFQYYFNFASSYSGVLYSLIKKSPTPNQCLVGIEDLKQLFGATSKSYADLRNFKVRILNPAVVDISKHSDIKLHYAEQKNSRKTERILFTW
jgi:plasmid replication initiation protein